MPEGFHARFTSGVTFREEPHVLAAIEQDAQARGLNASTWLREAARESLRARGIDPAQIGARDAGALYDSLEGKKRYACIEAGAIKSMGYYETAPDGWLPVVHEDSEPFDIVRHWRLAPVPRIEPDRVVMVYPVIVKSLEMA